MGYKNLMGYYKTKTYLSFLGECFLRPSSKILDIGGGSGRIAKPLTLMGFNVTIIDISKEAIILAKKHGINAVECDVFDFNEKNFDIVLAFEVVLYFNDFDELFRKINSFLKEEGDFIFTVRNSNSLYSKALRLIKRDKHPSQYKSFGIKYYNKHIEELGFKIVRIEGFKWVPFGIGSNNRFIHAFVFLEKVMLLKYFKSQSPQLIYHCRKISKVI